MLINTIIYGQECKAFLFLVLSQSYQLEFRNGTVFARGTCLQVNKSFCRYLDFKFQLQAQEWATQHYLSYALYLPHQKKKLSYTL